MTKLLVAVRVSLNSLFESFRRLDRTLGQSSHELKPLELRHLSIHMKRDLGLLDEPRTASRGRLR